MTFTSATTGVCTVSGATVTFVGAGTCTINANQAGNANYNAAPQVPQTFTVYTPGTSLTISQITVGPGHTVTASGTAAFGTAGDATTITVVFCKTTGTCTAGTNTLETATSR